ncbi:MAG: hypothetical protein JWN52_3984 [Actinomycetia bacterium]|nr:hypothetical protein [Actinomycetes bacterium]
MRRRILTDPTTAVPVEIRTSYLPASIADNTPLAAAEQLPEPWAQALNHYTGRPPAALTTHTSARRPTDTEAAALTISTTAVVSERRR